VFDPQINCVPQMNSAYYISHFPPVLSVFPTMSDNPHPFLRPLSCVYFVCLLLSHVPLYPVLIPTSIPTPWLPGVLFHSFSFLAYIPFL